MRLGLDFEKVVFFYPPHVEEYGYRMWHPYTPNWGEQYDQTQRSPSYGSWIETTAAEVWKYCDLVWWSNRGM